MEKKEIGDYEILHTIGTGSFGRVRLARVIATNEIIALKQLEKSQILKMKQVDHVVNEFSILRIVQHPFIVNLRYFTQSP